MTSTTPESLTTRQLVSIIIIMGLLIGGVLGGAYLHVQNSSSIPCLGCLGLSPISGEFEEFWVDYPEGHAEAGKPVSHPGWVLDALDDYDLIILFFWQIGCGPCTLQWEDMEDEGLVKGTEPNGELDKYSDLAFLYSIDVNTGNYRDVLEDYDPEGSYYGTPTTTFIVELDDNNIGWYSYKGQMDAETVENIIWIGLNIH